MKTLGKTLTLIGLLLISLSFAISTSAKATPVSFTATGHTHSYGLYDQYAYYGYGADEGANILDYDISVEFSLFAQYDTVTNSGTAYLTVASAWFPVGGVYFSDNFGLGVSSLYDELDFGGSFNNVFGNGATIDLHGYVAGTGSFESGLQSVTGFVSDRRNVEIFADIYNPNADGSVFVDQSLHSYPYISNSLDYTVEVASVPEPASMLLLGLGLAGLVRFRKS